MAGMRSQPRTRDAEASQKRPQRYHEGIVGPTRRRWQWTKPAPADATVTSFLFVFGRKWLIAAVLPWRLFPSDIVSEELHGRLFIFVK